MTNSLDVIGGQCCICKNVITENEVVYSHQHYGKPICLHCQRFMLCDVCRHPHKKGKYPEGLVIGKYKTKIILCEVCNQDAIKTLKNECKEDEHTTMYQVLVHLALEQRKIHNRMNEQIPYGDGKHKTIDIVIPQVSIYMEINGQQHANEATQVRSDLWRTYFAHKENKAVLNIYNFALAERFRFIIDALQSIVESEVSSTIYADEIENEEIFLPNQ
ncbi:hypothetical protein FACS189452_03710 [Bacteroidia bacterium]|nr:hypothetical protein FACS189452_03710 [Bacteroidia bacterium]